MVWSLTYESSPEMLVWVFASPLSMHQLKPWSQMWQYYQWGSRSLIGPHAAGFSIGDSQVSTFLSSLSSLLSSPLPPPAPWTNRRKYMCKPEMGPHHYLTMLVPDLSLWASSDLRNSFSSLPVWCSLQWQTELQRHLHNLMSHLY